MPRYRSTIPSGAKPKVVSKHEDGSPKLLHFELRGKLVGYRSLDKTGAVDMDCSLKNGRYHGLFWRLDAPDRVTSVQPYRDGLEHGISRQYDDDGTLIGTYRLVRGTGIDLWRSVDFDDGSIFLSEVHYMLDGRPHGFEWWINEDQRSVHHERHWHHGEPHGIERLWNISGRLSRDSPAYFIGGRKVRKREYLRACESDDTLPRWRASDNQPERQFPEEVRRNLRQRR